MAESPPPAAPVAPEASPSTAPSAAASESRLGFWLVLIGALAIRLWHLSARSVWTDEGTAWTIASSPLPRLIRLCAEKDASPPLFYLLTSLALRLGDSEAWLRSVSVAASLGVVWLTYRLSRLAAPRAEATLAAGIVALSPFQLMYAQEARTYMLVAFLALASLYLFARAVHLGRRRAWVPYVLVTALGLYTQSIAALGMGVQAALVLLAPSGRRRAKAWLFAQLAVAALYLPWLFVSLAQASRLHSSHWYLHPPGGSDVFKVLRAVFLSPVPLVTPPQGAPWPGLEAWLPRPAAQLLLIAIVAVPLLLAVRSALESSRPGSQARYAFLALFLPLAAVLAVSFKVPLWLPRYFVLLTPFLAMLLARGLVTLRPRALAAAWTALLLASLAYAVLRYDTDYTKEPWRETVVRIGAAALPGRSAALVTFDLDPFAYYDRRLPHPLPAFEVSHPAVPFASDYTAAQLDELEARARRDTGGYDEVWVVERSLNSPVRREVASRAERAAGAGRQEMSRERLDSVGGPIRIVRFARAGGGEPPRR